MGCWASKSDYFLILQIEVAIASKASNSSKDSLATTDFLAKGTASQLLRKPPSWNPPPIREFAIPKLRRVQ